MEELLNLIKTADNFYALTGADLSQVEEAENKLGVSFAEDYKAYVQAFGAATFDGHELTGVCNSDRLSVVSSTERAREFFPLFPKDLYVIEDMQFDHILTIQDSTGCIFSYGLDGEAKMIATSLKEYLFPDTNKSSAEGGTKNEQILRELLSKLQKHIADKSTIKNIVYTLNDIPEFMEMIDFLDNNQELSVKEIDMKAIEIAYNSYKGERE